MGEDRKPKILLCTGTFAPAFRTGGPARSMTNLVSVLAADFDCSVLTLSTDLGERMDVPTDRWLRMGDADRCYVSPERWSVREMAIRINGIPHDLLYLNGFNDYQFSIAPLWLRWRGRIPRRPVIVAPRGDFSSGCLSSGGPLKIWKKRIYRIVSRSAGLYRGVSFQATSDHEADDIRRFFPDSPIRFAPNLSDPIMPERRVHRKTPGTLRLVYLARIHEIKRTDWALERIAELRGDVRIDLYGPVDGQEYWNHCRELIHSLPTNVTAVYHGPLPHEQKTEAFADADFFILPTRNENFGHSIIEAMKYGCPVIISDRTCWRNLPQSRAGWDLPMDDAESWRATLQRCVDMGPEEYESLTSGAWNYAREHVNTPETVELSRRMFLDTLKEGTHDER
ncbi:MAG: glycosyltransferase [Planctomycetia bacterium]|nr:glycosyltransferase [Planctomycetia bacterium]